MEVWFDGKPLVGEVAGANLQELLENLMDGDLGRDRTLSNIKVNGQRYEQEVFGPIPLVGRERIERLEVETMDARQVAVHFLANSEHYLEAIIASVGDVAELFRIADEREASEQYLRTLESLQLFMQVVHNSREALGLDFDALVMEGLSLEERLRRLADLIQELLSAQEQEDWVLLADVLQYDLVEHLRGWSKVMGFLRESVVS